DGDGRSWQLPHPVSMVVARDALGRGDPLILDRGLQHHAFGELVDQPTLDLLPRRLVLRVAVAALALQCGTAGVVLLPGDQDVGGAPVEVDAHAVPGPEDGEPAAGGGLRRGVEHRWRCRGAGLAAVANAWQGAYPLLDEIARRPHVHDL